MTVSKLLSAIALAVIAASGAAHAETYQGVATVNSQQSREAINGQAVVAARSGNLYGDVAGEGVVQLKGRSIDRAIVRAEAVETAQAPNQNLDRKAFVNSVVPSQYNIQRTNTRQAGL
ncbi:MAG: alpha/beta hydrolase [Variovorax sp.]|nr:alpha/beta hydrolase [Variovorax sp.]